MVGLLTVAPADELRPADRWHAGALLMEAGNPGGWHALEAAAALWQANQVVLTTCRETAAKTRKEQRCPIIVPAP